MTLIFIDDLILFSGGSSGGFSPSTRGGQLSIWLQGSTITHSGSTITTWPDSSGNWTAATPVGTAPAFTASNASFNNKPTATYVAASNQQLRVASFAVSQPNTIYVVGQDTAPTANMIDGVTTRQIIGYNGNWNYFAGSVVTSGDLSTAPHAIAAVFNGASSGLYVDSSSVAVASGNPGTNALNGGLEIGSSAGPSAAITGDIAEIVITNVADTLAQRQAMFAYFASKYAGAWS